MKRVSDGIAAAERAGLSRVASEPIPNAALRIAENSGSLGEEKCPSAAKAAVDFLGLPRGINPPSPSVLCFSGAGLATEGMLRVKDAFAQGLKPILFFVAFAARLKSCPDASGGSEGVFPQPVKLCLGAISRPHRVFRQRVKPRFCFAAFAARLKLCLGVSGGSEGVFRQPVKSCAFKTKALAVWRGIFAIHMLCAVVFFIATATSGLAQAAPAITPATVYRIAGTVVNAVTGEPVPRANVAVLSESNREMIESVVTDNEGRFSLEGLAAGKYPLTASKRGFLTGFFEEHDGGYSSAIVTGEGQETGDLVFRLSPGARLHGVVLGDGGDPVEGAQVMLFVKPRNHNPGARIMQASNATTDDEGSYEFNDLASGEYLLAVSAQPWFAMNRSAHGLRRRAESVANSALDVAYPVTYYDSTTDESSATRIVLTSGSREEANINLRTAPALHLTLEAPTKQGAHAWPALEQTIFGAQFPANPNTSMDSKAADTFEFSGIPPGHYQLRYGNPPRVTQMDATTSQQIDPNLGVPTVAVSGSLRATSGFAIPENLNVILIPVGDTLGRAPLQANCVKGSFTLDAVPPGGWKLFAFSPGKTLSIGSISVGDRTQAGNSITVRDKPVKVEAAVSLGDTQVKGFARKNGKGMAGAMVVLVPHDPVANDDQFRRDQSDSDGSFTLRDAAPGEYTVVAIEEGWELDWARPEVIRRFLSKGVAVTVNEGSGKLMRLSEGVPVQGR
jgi:hypothetical protein